MQVLTGQYPTLYTHKFKIDYTDFKVGLLKTSEFNLLTLPKATQVVAIQYKQLVPFAGVNMGISSFRLFQSNALPASTSSVGSFLAINASQTVNEQQGALLTIQGRVDPITAGSQNLICNYNTPTTIVARMTISGSGNMSGLSAGSFWVWLVTMKMP